MALVAAVEFTFAFSSALGGGEIKIVTGGSGCSDYDKDLSGTVTFPSTNGWDVFTTLEM